MHHSSVPRCLLTLLAVVLAAGPARSEGEWEVTPASEEALERGLDWLARNQGTQGNWESDDLGLVSMGALAFLAAGHTPGVGKYGPTVERALDYVLRHAKDSGLLNISNPQRDMYNHGLSSFVLGQAHGMTGDPRLRPALDRALKLITWTQCDDGGWDYRAERQRSGHDLSLVVMQAKALRSAVDSGLEVPPEVVTRAIRVVRGYYRSEKRSTDEALQRQQPGSFTYAGDRDTVAMAACGVVCLQEFGQYDDWRIPKNLDYIRRHVKNLKRQPNKGEVPFDAYTLYYVGQALYQVGGDDWKEMYPVLRDTLVTQQRREARGDRDGAWGAGQHVHGKPGDLYGTAVACFILAIPNRYLPILQEGRIESLKNKFQAE